MASSTVKSRSLRTEDASGFRLGCPTWGASVLQPKKRSNKRTQPRTEQTHGMSDDGEGAAIREFSFVFETMSEITKAWKKDVQDSRFIKFLLHAGRARALDLFHRLDKGMTCGLV